MFVWNTFTNDARVFKEAASLAENGHRVTVVCIQDPDDPESVPTSTLSGFIVRRISPFPSGFGRKHICLPASGLPRSYMRLCVFLRMLRVGLAENADIYHSNDLNTLPQGWLCSKVFKRRRLIYDSHEVQSSRMGYGATRRLAERQLVKSVDRMLMTTDMRAEYTAKKLGIPKPTVIRNLPLLRDPDPAKGDLRELLGIPTDEPILLYQGGIQSGRGLEQIIDAVPMIRRGMVVMMGDGKLRTQVEALIRERQLENRIRMAPRVPYADLLHYTQHAYLGFQVIQNTCFNHYSTISNKLLEYIMAGVPVIASDFPEVRKIVAAHGVGLLVEPHDATAIAKAANTLLNDTPLWYSMREQCSKARQVLNWEQEEQRFLLLYGHTHEE